jgi:intracellular septation protein A
MSEGASADSTMKRLALDLASTLLFLAMAKFTNNMYLATGVGMAAGMAQLVWQKAHCHPVDGLQWLSLILVAILGTISLVTQDPRILSLQPSIIEATLGIYILRHPDYSFTYAPTVAKRYVPRRTKVVFGYLWAAGMFALAVSGLFVVQFASLRTWAIYKIVAAPLLMTLLGLTAAIVLPPMVRREKAAALAAARQADARPQPQ